MTTEQWAIIPDWPNYEITSAGMPRRVGKDKPIRVTYAGRYPKFTPSQDGKTKTVYIANAVWTAWVGPLGGGKITYQDGNPGNPRVGNLVVYDRLQRIRALMMPGGLHKRVVIDLSVNHGRLKPSTVCSAGHRLSMTGEPDDNTEIFLYGNRICLACRRGGARQVYPYNCPDYYP
jgi:hypothetical protein